MTIKRLEKCFVMSPIMFSKKGIVSIQHSVNNLGLSDRVCFMDPLSVDETNRDDFLKSWQKIIDKQIMEGMKNFIGFSFGAVLLKQLLAKQSCQTVKLVTLSSPSPLTKELYHALNDIKKLCLENNTKEGLIRLYQSVYAPNPIPKSLFLELDVNEAKSRLIRGFNLLFSISELIFNEKSVGKVLNLVGEKSGLVSRTDENSSVLVPNAGMRVLEDNLPFCLNEIETFFNAV